MAQEEATQDGRKKEADDAMNMFAAGGDVPSLQRAIEEYVRSARERGEPIEAIMASLNDLSATAQTRYEDNGRLLEPSRLQRVVLETVLVAFYGKAK